MSVSPFCGACVQPDGVGLGFGAGEDEKIDAIRLQGDLELQGSGIDGRLPLKGGLEVAQGMRLFILGGG